MKKDQITIGGIYSAKVSSRVVPVRIDRENTRGGWDATNLQTNRPVRIKSAQRLHKPMQLPGANDTPPPAPAAESPAPAKRGTQSQSATEPKIRKTRERMSCLDAAAKVLEEAGEPMNTKAMIEAMVARGYWTTEAPTPAATLYSAILRELQKKGDQSRFAKVERGKFKLCG